MAEPTATYDGFISYSHAADGLLAPRLQSALQRFAKPWWKRRAVRIFRDESSLSANPHLWSSITVALESSGWFVLLLSPDAAQSEWVNQEIAYWVEHRDSKKILPVVTDGEFGWAGGDVAGSAVPPVLRGVFEAEPRWVDLRFARGEDQLDLNNPSFSAAIADVASAVRGIPKDLLESEEVRQHRRTVRTAWTAGVLVTVLGIAAVGFGISSVRNAEKANRLAEAEADARADAEANAAQAKESADDAMEAATVALQQTAIAEEQARLAEEEARRADRTAKRLIDFVVRAQPADQAVGVVDKPTEYVPVGLSPSSLPTITEAPVGMRLDFRQETCQGEACFPIPSFVDPDRVLRTQPDFSFRTKWLAHEPFHIRHGFQDLPEGNLEGWLAAGYSVRLFVTKHAGPGSDDLDQARLYSAGATATAPDASCGPSLDSSGDHETCVAWVFEFPTGLQPGWYDMVVEWVAPCAAWFETDVCPFPSRPTGLVLVGGTVGFLSEEYTVDFAGGEAWPFDPWARAEPLPEKSP